MAEQDFVDSVDEDQESETPPDPILNQILSHMAMLKGQVSVSDLDMVMRYISLRTATIKELERAVKQESKVLYQMKSIAMGVLKDLGRLDYKSPAGSIKIQEKLQVRNPQTPEDKALLWEWMREKGIYDRYAQVHASSLKSLFESELEIAQQEQGDEFDPVLFTLPGMAPATFFEDLKFTPAKK